VIQAGRVRLAQSVRRIIFQYVNIFKQLVEIIVVMLVIATLQQTVVSATLDIMAWIVLALIALVLP
jgi:hypothetical protein